MKSFQEWLKKKDPELAEGILGKIGALALPMGGAIVGGGAGLLAGPLAPLTAPTGWVAGKELGVQAAQKLFPKDTAELMKKKMKK